MTRWERFSIFALWLGGASVLNAFHLLTIGEVVWAGAMAAAGVWLSCSGALSVVKAMLSRPKAEEPVAEERKPPHKPEDVVIECAINDAERAAEAAGERGAFIYLSSNLYNRVYEVEFKSKMFFNLSKEQREELRSLSYSAMLTKDKDGHFKTVRSSCRHTVQFRRAPLYAPNTYLVEPRISKPCPYSGQYDPRFYDRPDA